MMWSYGQDEGVAEVVRGLLDLKDGGIEMEVR